MATWAWEGSVYYEKNSAGFVLGEEASPKSKPVVLQTPPLRLCGCCRQNLTVSFFLARSAIPPLGGYSVHCRFLIFVPVLGWCPLGLFCSLFLFSFVSSLFGTRLRIAIRTSLDLLVLHRLS